MFAIPGSIHNPMARGCHRLLREGAKLVESAGDILEELAPLLGLEFPATEPPSGAVSTEALEDPEYRLLLNSLDVRPHLGGLAGGAYWIDARCGFLHAACA